MQGDEVIPADEHRRIPIVVADAGEGEGRYAHRRSAARSGAGARSALSALRAGSARSTSILLSTLSASTLFRAFRAVGTGSRGTATGCGTAARRRTAARAVSAAPLDVGNDGAGGQSRLEARGGQHHEARAVHELLTGLLHGGGQGALAPTGNVPLVHQQGVDRAQGVDGGLRVEGDVVVGPGVVGLDAAGGQQTLLEPVRHGPARGAAVGHSQAPGRHLALGVVRRDPVGQRDQLVPGVRNLVPRISEGLRGVPHEGLDRGHERRPVEGAVHGAGLGPGVVPAELDIGAHDVGQRAERALISEIRHEPGLRDDGEISIPVRRPSGPAAQVLLELVAALVHDINTRALLEARQGLLEALPLRAGQGSGDLDGAARPVLGRVSGEDLAGAEVGVMVVRPAAGGQARTGQRQDGGERKRTEGMSEQ